MKNEDFRRSGRRFVDLIVGYFEENREIRRSFTQVHDSQQISSTSDTGMGGSPSMLYSIALVVGSVKV